MDGAKRHTAGYTTSPTMYARYVGRVGALAVALGVGAAVATTPGVAWADETSTSSDSGPSASSKSETDTSGESQDATPISAKEKRDAIEKRIEKRIEKATDAVRKIVTDVAKSSGEAITSTQRLGVRPTRTKPVPPDPSETSPVATSGAPQSSATNGSVTTPAETALPAAESTQSALRTQTPQVSSRRVSAPITEDSPTATTLHGAIQRVRESVTAGLDPVVGPQKPASVIGDLTPVEQQRISAPVRAPLSVVTRVLSAALAPFLGAGTPGQPAPQNPVLWGVLAWVRRQVQETPFGKAVFNRTPEITTSDVAVVDNGDGTFTITPAGSDPDGDDLAYTLTGSGAGEGTLLDNQDGTFTYAVGNPTGWDGSDTVTVTVSDATSPHVHGLLGLFNPRSGHTDSVVITIAASDGALPPPPDIVIPPTKRPDDSGIYDTVLQYDADKIADVKAAPGFEPKYWRVVSETYDPVTGEYRAELVPTQAGQLRAALGLDTTDDLKLQVTNQPTTQMFAMRSAGFAAIEAEDPPDQALQLPTPPAGEFVIDEQAIPVGSKPAGVIVTEKYAYILNSKLDPQGGASNSVPSTVTVIGADPTNVAEYNKVVENIPVGVNPAFAGLIDDRLYVVNSSITSASTPSTITIIDTDDNTIVDADPDDNENDVDAINLPNGAFFTVVSPDEKRMYVINQQRDGNVYVIDTDETSPTYNEALDLNPGVDGVQGIPLLVQTRDADTGKVTYAFPISGALNADGSRLYIVRDVSTQTPTDEGVEIGYDGELIVIDTATNTAVGDPIPLGQFGGYASSDGSTLYVPTLDLEGYDPRTPNSPPPPGYVTVVDIESDPDNPTLVDLDPNTPELDRLGVGKLPYNIVYSPDRSLAYVISTGDGTVKVIDTATNSLIDLDPTAPDVQGIVYNQSPSGSLQDQDASFIGISPDGNQLYVTNNKGNTVTAFSFVTATADAPTIL